MNGLWQFDMDGFRAIHVGLHSPILDPVFWIISSSGLGWVQFIGASALLLSPRARRFAYPIIAVILVGGLALAQGLKAIIPRDRPSLLAFARPQETVYTHSFPSGHTTSSFGVAVLLLLMTWRTPTAWVGWVGLFWAALVGFSRIYRGVHWPTDVIGGACCGTIAACLVYGVWSRWIMQTPNLD